MEKISLNVPSVTVEELVEMLSTLYAKAVKNQESLKELPTPFLWGPAGIGKSQGVRQLGKRLEKKSGKRVHITDVRLLLFSPIDLRGMPTVDSEKKLAVWLKPEVFNMNENKDIINILLLDELSAAPQSVQAAAYQICLDRKIGEHRLPDNCIVIAAGNRTTDQSISYKMPKALCNRMMHFNVDTNYAAWLKWAMSEDIDSRIIGYLAFDNSKLCIDPASEDLAYTTPRSWVYVDRLIKNHSGDLGEIHPLISGCVGIDTALEFEAWVKVHDRLPTAEEVLNGQCKKYPDSYDVLVAFTASLVSAIRARREQITAQELENACAYMNNRRIPEDYTMTFYSDLNTLEELRLKLMKCPSSRQWLAEHKQCI